MDKFLIYCDVILGRDDAMVTKDVIELSIEIGRDIKESIVEYFEHREWKLIKVTSIRIVPKCYGCRNNRASQVEHMEEGGCLYQPSREV
jgi:hypothetical protein